MIKIEPSQISENTIKLIGKDFMLIGAGDATASNAMTASWGTIGYYSNRPIVTIFVRPERYTYQFIEQHKGFTLTFLGEGQREAFKKMGTLSGRDCNKVAEAGLTPTLTENGNPTFEEATLVIECEKIFSQRMGEESFIDKECYNKWYGEGHGGDHILYIGAIEACWIKE